MGVEDDTSPPHDSEYSEADHQQWLEIMKRDHPEFLEELEKTFGEPTHEKVMLLVELDAGRARLSLSLANLERIRRLWDNLFGHQWFKFRAPGDEHLYQALRYSLMAQLESDPAFSDLYGQANEAVPEILPTQDELIAFDEEILSFYERGFQELEARIIAQALASRDDLDIRRLDPFFEKPDEILDQLERDSQQHHQKTAAKYGLNPVQKTTEGLSEEKLHNDSAADTAPGRGAQAANTQRGRKPNPLTYETAQSIWWEMVDEYSDTGERRKPNQVEFCQRLTALGHAISDRAFRDKKSIWAKQGLVWEPPRPHE